MELRERPTRHDTYVIHCRLKAACGWRCHCYTLIANYGKSMSAIAGACACNSRAFGMLLLLPVDVGFICTPLRRFW